VQIFTLRFGRSTFIFLSFVILLALEIAAYKVESAHFNESKNVYLSNLAHEWEEEYLSVQAFNKSIAESIFQNISSSPDLKALLKATNKPGDLEKAHGLLLARYQGLYKATLAHSLNIFQIQDAKGNVIVRFQKPENYGDNVLDSRQTISLAHTTKNDVHGFELGKSFNAYRHAFPIVESGELLGSVEIGFDESMANEALKSHFKMHSYYAILSSSSHLIDSSDIEESHFSDANNKFVHKISAYRKSGFELRKKIFNSLTPEHRKAIAEKKKFTFFAAVESGCYAVTAIPLYDYSGKHVGYVGLYDKDMMLPVLEKEFHTSITLIMLLVLALWGAVFDFGLRFFRKNRFLSQHLEEQKRNLNTLVNTIPDLVWVKDLDGVYLSCNPKFEFFFGAKESEIVGKTDFDFVPADLATFFRQKDIEAMQKDSPSINTEWVTLAGNGQRVMLETIKTPLKTEDGEVVGVLGISRDITELHETIDRLRTSETMLNEAQRIAQIGSWEWNTKTDVHTWSEEIYHIYGRDKSLPPANTEEVAKYFSPESWKLLESAVKKGVSEGIAYVCNAQVVRPDGSRRWVTARGEVVRDENGEQIGIRGTLQDITELMMANMELENLNKTLSEKVQVELAKSREKDLMILKQSRLATIGELMSNIAHQWRQPLNALGINIQDIKYAFNNNEVNKAYIDEFIDNCMRSISYLSNTINSFKDFFRPSSGKERFDIAEITMSTFKLLKDAYLDMNIVFDIKTAESEIFVYGYKQELAQVLTNIISNSKDAFDLNNTINPKISLEWKSFDGKVKISIFDNGGGVPEGIIEKIFDPYFTTKFKSQGVGVGLYMAKAIIENDMNGTLRVHNTADGACFEIELPISTT
jgi:PAS domain S-box-containing protein